MSQSPSFPLRVVSYATSIIVTRKVIIKMMLRVTSVMLWSNHLIGISFNPHNNLIRKMLRLYIFFPKEKTKFLRAGWWQDWDLYRTLHVKLIRATVEQLFRVSLWKHTWPYIR